MTFPVIPLLSYDSPLQTVEPDPVGTEASVPERLLVPFDGVKLGGEPFPWATVGDWVLTLPEDGIATLTVHIAVTIGPTPKARP